jgi:hypothetical protein
MTAPEITTLQDTSALIERVFDHYVHMVMMGKGGVGKSSLAAFLAQFLGRPDGRGAICIDTDPVNASFAAYQTLGAHRVELMQDEQINPRRFDDVIERIVSEERDAVIDSGASSFVPLAHYMLTNQIPALLRENRRQLVLHAVVVGGPAIVDTLHGLNELVRHFDEPTRFVVWLNPYFGPVSLWGKDFEELKVYTENRHRISALIKLPTLQPDTFGADLRTLLTARRTFREALEDPKTGIVAKQRLKLIQQRVFAQLQAASTAGIL